MYGNFSFFAHLLPVVEHIEKKKKKNTVSMALLNLSDALAGCYANEGHERGKQTNLLIDTSCC